MENPLQVDTRGLSSGSSTVSHLNHTEIPTSDNFNKPGLGKFSQSLPVCTELYIFMTVLPLSDLICHKCGVFLLYRWNFIGFLCYLLRCLQNNRECYINSDYCPFILTLLLLSLVRQIAIALLWSVYFECLLSPSSTHVQMIWPENLGNVNIQFNKIDSHTKG